LPLATTQHNPASPTRSTLPLAAECAQAASPRYRNPLSLWLSAVLLLLLPLLSQAEEAFHIALIHSDRAVANPVSGENVNGIMLYLDRLNEGGGLDGVQVVIDHYNDSESVEGGVEVAKRIIDEGRVVAVIGHEYSSVSLATGPLYAEAGIPVITYNATNNRVTEGNDWFFRTIFNDASQGAHLASYAVKALGQPRVSVIKESWAYGDYLGSVFAETAVGLGAVVDGVYVVDPDNEPKQAIGQIVDQLIERGEEAGLLFLALHESEAAELVRRLRDAAADNLLMGPDTLASSSFTGRFSRLPQEQIKPGFYTNNIQVTAPINFDAASEEAQRFLHHYQQLYGHKPDWNAAFSHDTIKVLVEAIRRANPGQKQSQPLSELRQAIRRQLEAMRSKESGVAGVTGTIFFNSQGDVERGVALARYYNNTLISSTVNYLSLEAPLSVDELQRKIASGDVIELNGRYLLRQQLVNTGVKMHRIGPYDEQKQTIGLDFTLWFRFRGDIAPQQIIFANGLEPFDPDQPVESWSDGEQHYLAYHVSAPFRTNFAPSQVAFGEHVAGFSFRHKSLDRKSLIYITDVVGMGLTGENRLTDRVRRQLVFDQLEGWPLEVASSFERIAAVDTLGYPDHLNSPNAVIDHSEFVYALYLQQSNRLLRGSLPDELAERVALLSAIVLLALIGWRKLIRQGRPFSRLLWLPQVTALLLLLIASEILLINNFLIDQQPHIQQWVITAFDVLWWMVPALIVSDAVEIFVWQAIERSSGRQIPGVVRVIAATIIFTMAIFGVVAFVFEQKLTGLMATSGLLAMIIGLAVQMNLSNIFSGIALNIERPFRVGDWVRIDTHEGRVVDVTWRATRIINNVNQLISIPNTPAANAAIINYSASGSTRYRLSVVVDSGHQPEQIRAILREAMLGVDEVLLNPPPKVFLEEIDSEAASYAFLFSYEDYGRTVPIIDHVWRRVHQLFARHGIEAVGPRSRMIQISEVKKGSRRFDLLQLLRQTEIFHAFPAQVLHRLAVVANRRSLAAGERLLKQGDLSRAMYLVADGVLAVYRQTEEGGDELEVGRLRTPDTFGGHALLHGEPRTASIEAVTEATVFGFERDDMLPLFDTFPEVLDHFKEATRQQVHTTTKRVADHEREVDSRRGVLGRIVRRLRRGQEQACS
jgi:potassium efflux system protein